MPTDYPDAPEPFPFEPMTLGFQGPETWPRSTYEPWVGRALNPVPITVGLPWPALDRDLAYGLVPPEVGGLPDGFLFGGGLFGQAVTFSAPPVVFEDDLQGYLKAKLGVEVWAGKLPQRIRPAHLPALVYNLITADSVQMASGASGVTGWHVQFDAYGRKPIDAAALLESLRRSLQGYRGVMGRTAVLNASLHDQGSGFEPLPSGGGTGTYRRMMEFTIWYREAVPRF